MTYHPLTQDSGSTPAQRRAEADKLCTMLQEAGIEQMQSHEQSFVESISQEVPVSPKQLFWLRDLKGKYAE